MCRTTPWIVDSTISETEPLLAVTFVKHHVGAEDSRQCTVSRKHAEVRKEGAGRDGSMQVYFQGKLKSMKELRDRKAGGGTGAV